MGGIIESALFSILLHYLLNPFLSFLGWALGHIANGSLAMANAPWVHSAEAVSATFAGTLLGLYVAWKALTEYILWNEGSGSDATGYWAKAILRVFIYGAISGFLPYAVFAWGIQYGAALVAAPAKSTISVLQTMVSGLTGMGGVDMLVLALMIVVVLIAILIVFVQMFIRGAELTIYVIAAPLMALGWLNTDGGVWQAWWKNLVILSMSSAVQWLALKGLVVTVVVAIIGTPFGAFEAILMMLAWAWVAIRGAHMLQQWSYRTGMGGGMMQFGGMILSKGGPKAFFGLGGK